MLLPGGRKGCHEGSHGSVGEVELRTSRPRPADSSSGFQRPRWALTQEEMGQQCQEGVSSGSRFN